MATPFNQSAFLRVQRSFPEDSQALSVELSKAYIDIAQNVNRRTIGVFANTSTITGNSWFLTGGSNKQQTLRQVYPFTTAANIPHGIILANITGFVPTCYGSFTDGTNWYGLIFASNVAIAGQRTFYVDPTNIVMLAGAGAPAIVSGWIVLEWLSKV